MLRVWRFVVLVEALLALPRVADACSCLAASPCRQYANADAVFAGDVVEVTEQADPGAGRKTVHLRVGRTYKGMMTVGQVVAVAMPGGSSASCSLDVTAGSRYVIYAGLEKGRISTNLCRGSHPLAAGAAWPPLPPEGGVVSGRLTRDDLGAGRPRPLGGVAVWIATPGRRFTANTDAAGAFRLTGVPAGTWTVEFGLGPDERADEKIELQSADDCAELYPSPRPRGR